MKICIPIQQKKEGGMYTFLGLFRFYLTSKGIEHFEDINKPADILFVNSWVVPFSVILKAKKNSPNLRVAHRIDGSAVDYGRKDNSDRKQAKVNLLADLTIFQSRYAKYATREKYKIISNDGPVIYNAVDTDIFAPEGKKEDLAGRTKLAYVSYSTNPKKGAAALYAIVKQNPDLEFYLIGRYEDPPSLSNLHILGLMNNGQLAAALRSCHIFLFLSENEACPNVVLEAMACGLPVLYKDSGGTAELVGDCGLAVTVENFRQQLQDIFKRKEDISNRARQRAVENFVPDIIFPKYLEAISSCVRQPLPKLIEYIRFMIRIKQ